MTEIKFACLILGETTIGPDPALSGPRSWDAPGGRFRSIWISTDTCGACRSTMARVPFGPAGKGSLSATWRCPNRVEPIAYSFWNECRSGGRGFYVDRAAVEQERLAL